LRVEAGETVIVGVNRFGADEPFPDVPQPDYPVLESEQVARLRRARAARNARAVRESLGRLRSAATATMTGPPDRDVGLVEAILECVRARASVGEISDALADAWGRYAGQSRLTRRTPDAT
jgi:methylmalonyl-CoA mutase N-terminal domain/subunit